MTTTSAETSAEGTGVQAERTSAGYAAQVLRDRAESYWRDSVVFREDGDLHAAVAYKMIAEELRLCADILKASP